MRCEALTGTSSSSFLRLALLPPVSNEELPLLLLYNSVTNKLKLLQSTEVPLGSNGNVKSWTSFSVSVKSTKADFFLALSRVPIHILSP